MRVKFNLDQFESFTFVADGAIYAFSSMKPLAKKSRLATNISEYVYKLPTGKHVYLTIVGDEDQTSGYGIHSGWYVAEIITDESAAFAIKAFEKFTELYK